MLPKVAVSLPQLGIRERVACHKPAAAKKIGEFGKGLQYYTAEWEPA